MRHSCLGLAGVAALAAGALIGGTTGTGEHVGFAPKTVTVGEQDGRAVVTVARDACENAAFILAWSAPHTSTAADHGSAAEGEDYEPASSSERWESCAPGTGTATQVLTVPILDDDEIEEDETIKMSLRARTTSTNQTLLPEVDPDGTIVIVDDDGTPTQTQTTPTQTTPTQTQTQTTPPATTATTPPPAPVVTTPRSSTTKPRACTSKRRFTLNLGAYRSAKVRVGDEPMKVRRVKGKLVATVDLRGNREGRYTVKITARTASGKSVAKIRRYRTCKPKQDT